MKKKMIFFAPLAALGIVVFIIIGGEIVMHLWNWLVPSIIGWHQITFWEAFGILILCRILFGGHGWHRSGRSKFRDRIKERCGNMTPEERERFRQRVNEKFGFGPSAGENKPPDINPTA
jgi:hypothetical protein